MTWPGEILSPRLPLGARARFYAERRIDSLCAWLCGHRCTLAAELLWRACRMW
ncbi:hypothetical protein [Streptomyces cupreus]|uniref:Uncharacterized protein n=1 Tax=Streptomyces cupreus TaxID=2759956 RepID=A0A7X1J3V5_9ACTN|nr:hypothetical protein [Streptomyces cupreus]MBC2903169.1 hypothetical protein [Streptomyces cupreus]